MRVMHVFEENCKRPNSRAYFNGPRDGFVESNFCGFVLECYRFGEVGMKATNLRNERKQRSKPRLVTCVAWHERNDCPQRFYNWLVRDRFGRGRRADDRSPALPLDESK